MQYMNILKKIFNVIFYSLLILIIVLFTVFDYRFYNVLTGSMYPTIKPGSLIIVKPQQAEELKIGDIVTFRSENSSNLTTHRIKSIENKPELQFITQGDANNIEDPMPLDKNLIIGKVICFIPFIGAIMAFIKDNIKIMMLFLFMFILVVSWSKTNKQIETND